jgi:hypothetical protein
MTGSATKQFQSFLGPHHAIGCIRVQSADLDFKQPNATLFKIVIASASEAIHGAAK